MNKAEVAGGRWLGQWRGALGWSLVASLRYQFILYPFLIAAILIFDPPPRPVGRTRRATSIRRRRTRPPVRRHSHPPMRRGTMPGAAPGR